MPKELVILSGKGGTGKTTVAASFAALARQVVLADCDVDAADLHLLLHPVIQQQNVFRSGATAVVKPELCTQCGQCQEVCRFDAIDEGPVVNSFACEGCNVCFYVCPVNAIEMQPNISGDWFISKTRYGSMVHARLHAAEENSGKLVALVRQHASRLADEEQQSLILIDGPPGIGCPVISSVTGADLVLAVTEPTLSGMHDLQRVTELTGHFGIPTCVCVNKYDINLQITAEIEAYCTDQGLQFLGAIPYEKTVIEALVRQMPVVSYTSNGATEHIRRIWQQIERLLA